MRALVLAGVVAAAIASATAGAAGAPQERTAEYDVKAAFLLNFAKFVDWPPRAFAGPDGPLTICVLGADPFGQTLDDTLRDERIGGLRLLPARVMTVAEAHRCHIVYVSPSEEPRYAAILDGLDTRRVLTVGDSPTFLEAGGHLRFYLESNNVRFAVNPESVARAQFRISSKLMRVATLERPARRGEAH
jgi:hypothetical protein